MMKNKQKNLDLLRAVRTTAEINRACKALRRAYLEGRKEELLSIFQEYKNRTETIKNPDPDAISKGFIECWKNRDYRSIAEVGELLDQKFFGLNREEEAFYILAKKFIQEDGPN